MRKLFPRASMAAQAAWQKHSWRVFSSKRLSTAPTDRAENCALHKKFPARAGLDTLERRPAAGAQDGRPLSSSAHARTTQDPDRARHGSLPPAALGPRCSKHPLSISSTQSHRVTVAPSAMISSGRDGVSFSLLNVVRMLRPGEPVGVLSAENIVS